MLNRTLSFEEIYTIATTAKDYADAYEQFYPALEQDTDIDIMRSKEQFTAASLLASQGNIKAVKILLQFGANAILCLQQAQIANQTQLIQLLETTYGATHDLNSTAIPFPNDEENGDHETERDAITAALTRDHAYILEKGFHNGTYLNTLAQTSAAVGDFTFASFLFTKKQAYIKAIVEGAYSAGYFNNEKIALHTLVFLKNRAFRNAIIEELYQLEQPLTFNVAEISQRTQLICGLLHSYPFSDCMNKSIEVLETITASEQKYLNIYRKSLCEEISNYAWSKRTFFFFSNTPEADKFLQEIQTAPNIKIYLHLLNHAPTLDKIFNTIIDKYTQHPTTKVTFSI